MLTPDLVQADGEIVGVERIMQNRKRLRPQILAADRLISVAEGDVRGCQETGSEHISRQSERGNGIVIRKILGHAFGETETASPAVGDAQDGRGIKGAVVVDRSRVRVAAVGTLRAGVGDIPKTIGAVAGALRVGEAAGQYIGIVETFIDLDVIAMIGTLAGGAADP